MLGDQYVPPHYSIDSLVATESTNAAESIDFRDDSTDAIEAIKGWVAPTPLLPSPSQGPPPPGEGIIHNDRDRDKLFERLQSTGTPELWLAPGDPVTTLISFLAEHNIPVTDRLGYTKGPFPTNVYYYVLGMLDGMALWTTKTDEALGYSGEDFIRDPGLLRRIMPAQGSHVDVAGHLCSGDAQEYVYYEDVSVRVRQDGSWHRFFSQGQVVLWNGTVPAWVVREIPMDDPKFAMHIEYSFALSRRMGRSASPQVFLVVERATKKILFCNREDYMSILGIPGGDDFLEDAWLKPPCNTVVRLGGGLRWIVVSVHHGANKVSINFRSIDQSTSPVPYEMCTQRTVDLESIDRVLEQVHGAALPRLTDFESNVHLFIAKHFQNSLGTVAAQGQRELWTLQGTGHDHLAARNMEQVLGVTLKQLRADYLNGTRASFLNESESLRLASQWETSHPICNGTEFDLHCSRGSH